jgi:hypothetical protein
MLWRYQLESHLLVLATYFHLGILFYLFFNPEDEDNFFPRNVSWLLTDYTALCPGRWYST